MECSGPYFHPAADDRPNDMPSPNPTTKSPHMVSAICKSKWKSISYIQITVLFVSKKTLENYCMYFYVYSQYIATRHNDNWPA